MLSTGQDPSQIIEEKNLLQVSDAGELEGIVAEIIKANPKPVEDLQAGKQNALQFLVGQGMKMSKGKASPTVLQDLFKKKIG
jgi:aspartyl-tRNA(Asn)/glutamyl-tRNA(Gln) amidotransferase subunit B